MKVKKLKEHAVEGSRWLLDHQNKDGSWIGLDSPKVDAFYKVSLAFLVTDQLVAADRNLTYVKEHFLTSDGDFLPRGHPSHINLHYLYPNSYLINGSVRAGRFEMVKPSILFLLRHQDPIHGGFYSRRINPGQSDISDSISTSAAGIACLAAGRIDAARHAGEWLAHLVDVQPYPRDGFFTTLEADGKLRTAVKDKKEAYSRIISTKRENQNWYAVGLPFAFLIQLAKTTGSVRYRELAQWYFDFQMQCVDPWDGSSSGKSGWACAMLYRITGERKYRDIALHIAQNILSRQNADGSWLCSWERCNHPEEHRFTDADFDVTAEFTLWVALITNNILSDYYGSAPHVDI